MHIPALLVLLVIAVMVIFASANGISFMALTTLSLLFTNIQVPLGLIMLGFTVLLSALFLLFIVYLQASLLGVNN